MLLNIKYLKYLIIALFSVVLCSCSDSKNSDDLDTPPVGTTRTVLVYMVAANDLGSSGLDQADIEEMQQAATQGDFGNSRLLVYQSPYNGEVQLKEINADGSISVLERYESSANGASVTAERMRKVIDDVKRHAPAGDYGLVLWSHASGWIADGILDSEKGNSGIKKSYGQDRGKRMNISTLARAVSNSGFSFIYFDCCFMGTVEVAYEMRKATKIAVVSAAEVALPGMPYHLSLKPMMAEKADLVEVARRTYEYYQGQAAQYDRSCTISVLDLTYMDLLAEATRNVYASSPTIVPEGYSPVRYCNRAPYKNYYFDFKHYVTALIGDNQVAYDHWRTQLDRVVIYKAATDYFQSNVDLSQHSGALHLYFCRR